MHILVPNLGSTSLKYQILDMPAERILGRGKRERVADYGEALQEIAHEGVAIDAIALKAVHGGPRYRGTFIVDDGVIDVRQPHAAILASSARCCPRMPNASASAAAAS